MKPIYPILAAALLLGGCATPKIRVPVEANKITYYNPVVATLMDCMPVISFTVPEQHPNNFERYIKVEAFKQGGTHYTVHVTDRTWKDQPVEGEVDVYFCREKAEEKAASSPPVQPQTSASPVYIINNTNNNH
ncbi:hypothetical protein [Ferrimonas balearica]|uniref:hypothetical protein n=1 Tax=Ferrimonas balearica TaxID=44012 RepID=UPI001C98E43B|nr:hypothetical protein [Ferrimonas balearica]MBY6224721.1 hypothetical protein [Ferrimonas balearica]